MVETAAQPIILKATLPAHAHAEGTDSPQPLAGGTGRNEPSRLLRRAAPALFFAARFFVFAAASPLRPAARLILRRSYSALRDRFDRAFYLSQIVSAWDRACAARDPILHYLCVGRHLGLSPDIDFDPRHYRDDHPSLPGRD